MRVAVVGCGYWGSKHVRVLHSIPGVDRVIAVDQNRDRLESLKQSFPGLIARTSMESALEDVDAVVVATPPGTHVELALRAIEAGKGVLVEKPLATNTADARLIVDEAADRSVVLMVGHTFEYNAAVWKLRELVESEELGRVLYVDSARLNLGLYQKDVNVVWDLAPHDVSIFNYVLGATPKVVEAWGLHNTDSPFEDVAYLRLRYDEPEVTGTIHVSWLDPCKVRRVTVVGSSKMAVYNDLAVDERIRIYDKGVDLSDGTVNLQNPPTSYRYGDIRSPFIPFEEPLFVEATEFTRCVAHCSQPQTDGRDGLAVVEVLECAEISLREGRPVEVEEVEEVGELAPTSALSAAS
jgi:predicted dehydrogenase